MTPYLSTSDQVFTFRAVCVSFFVVSCVALYFYDRLRGRAGGDL